MRFTHPVYELRQRWTRSDTISSAVALAASAAVCLPAVPSWASGTVWMLSGVTVFGTVAAIPRNRRTPVLRVDSQGITITVTAFSAVSRLPPDAGRRPGDNHPMGHRTLPILWADAEALVIESVGRSRSKISVAVTTDYLRALGVPPYPGPGNEPPFARWVDHATGLRTEGTLVYWTGPDTELTRLASALAHLAPQVPVIRIPRRRRHDIRPPAPQP